jgi:3-deoxy-D-manno-octulosonic-acid transferase
VKLENHRVALSWSTRAILWLYEFFWYLALPIALLRLFWKGRIQKEYRQNIFERLGIYRKNLNKNIVWIHAVSVGETRAAAPLINALIIDGHQILLTHMTPTGRATGADIFSKAIGDGQLQQVYLPYDISFLVTAFFRVFSPAIGLIMETEVWPNLILKARQLNIPVLLINARLSKRSAHRVAKFGATGSAIYGSFSQILAQTNLDAKRYQSLGLSNVRVTGNLKFDVQMSAAQIDHALQIRKLLPTSTRLICAASTREGEEEMVIQAWLLCLQQSPNILSNARLLIVPRHPQRFEQVYQVITSKNLAVVKRSNLDDHQLVDAIQAGSIILGDSMGEMGFYYALSDVVVMGGSLQPLGGQNFIEACSLGRPIILGEHTFNFQQASMDAIEQGAALRVVGLEELSQLMSNLIQNDILREKMSANAIDFAGQHTGATEKILAVIQSYIDIK